ncbi:helix-turn-helix domain-containing protein [Kutzneria kofuensis]|uniref:helix-turn-helix domain-containing protein n=1 Tax=Kutzneria kofuensis TaxID=103725 RepID=UPI0031E74D47
MNGLHATVWCRVLRELDRLPAAQRAKAADMVRLSIGLLCSDGARGMGDEWDARKVAAVRTMGHSWAIEQWPLDQLLELQGKVCEEAVAARAEVPGASTERLRALAEASNRFMRELLHGFQEVQPAGSHRRPSHDEAAAALLRGEVDAADGRFARAYAVMAFRTVASPAARRTVMGKLGADVLSAVCAQGGYVLVPAEDENAGFERCTGLHALLPEHSWAGVSWQQVDRVPAGRIEAVDVVAAALAARRRPGCYLLGDVPVEYAVLTHPSVAGLLAAKIEPVTRIPVLLATLRALLAADGNRSRAATDLMIHRSTLDYRLRRIEQLTGHDPTSARRLQVLGTALTAYEAAARPLPPLPLPLPDGD